VSVARVEVQAREIVSRTEAQERGLTRYIGKPCSKHGAAAERFTSGGRCVECQYEYAKYQYRTHLDQIREIRRCRRANNLDHFRDVEKRWRAAQRDKKLEREASNCGLFRYVGKPCKHGHIERFVSDDKCVGCARERLRRWSFTNRERQRQNYQRQNRRRGVIKPLHATWFGMIQRCHNPNHRRYADWGGRGIKVCDRWRYGENGMSGYECFVADMGPKPSSKHSIHRVDNDGSYDPTNCVWADAKTQRVNRRPCRSREVVA
jgi:hypothetical protein